VTRASARLPECSRLEAEHLARIVFHHPRALFLTDPISLEPAARQLVNPAVVIGMEGW
jgi:hypothetical protein